MTFAGRQVTLSVRAVQFSTPALLSPCPGAAVVLLHFPQLSLAAGLGEIIPAHIFVHAGGWITIPVKRGSLLTKFPAENGPGDEFPPWRHLRPCFPTGTPNSTQGPAVTGPRLHSQLGACAGALQGRIHPAWALLLHWKWFRALHFLLFAHKTAISDSRVPFLKEIPNLLSEYLMS